MTTGGTGEPADHGQNPPAGRRPLYAPPRAGVLNWVAAITAARGRGQSPGGGRRIRCPGAGTSTGWHEHVPAGADEHTSTATVPTDEAWPRRLSPSRSSLLAHRCCVLPCCVLRRWVRRPCGA